MEHIKGVRNTQHIKSGTLVFHLPHYDARAQINCTIKIRKISVYEDLSGDSVHTVERESVLSDGFVYFAMALRHNKDI